jgi:high-affinity nickel-transport protein
LFLLNILVWSLSLIYTKSYPFLLGLITLAYGLGLRHGVDADHIAAIDNTTRKLLQDGKKPLAVGLFFSLGHSTIVIVLSLLVAFSSSFIINNLPFLKQTGSIIGASISSIFLLIIGIINLLIFIDLYKIWRHVIKGGFFHESHIDNHLHNRGLIAKFLKPLLKSISNSWNMYPVGLLFGLGFDTASEVALLSLSAVNGANNLPAICIILLPLAFTAGMTLVDTLDGILMLGAYGWAYIRPVRKLYYNLNITFISVIVALFIGSIEGLQVIGGQIGNKRGIFWLVNQIEFNYLGYVIIGAFIISWLFSALIYRLKKYDSITPNHSHSRP